MSLQPRHYPKLPATTSIALTIDLIGSIFYRWVYRFAARQFLAISPLDDIRERIILLGRAYVVFASLSILSVSVAITLISSSPVFLFVSMLGLVLASISLYTVYGKRMEEFDGEANGLARSGEPRLDLMQSQEPDVPLWSIHSIELPCSYEALLISRSGKIRGFAIIPDDPYSAVLFVDADNQHICLAIDRAGFWGRHNGSDVQFDHARSMDVRRYQIAEDHVFLPKVGISAKWATQRDGFLFLTAR